MKKIITILCCAPALLMAQTSGQLDINNLDVTINFKNGNFSKIASGQAGFEAPKGSGKTVAYGQGFWIGGTDVNGQLKLAAQTYGTSGTTDFAGSCDPTLHRLFKVDKDSIDYHIANHTNPGYVMPTQIADWPGNGDVSCGMPFYLAPFVDVDGDSIYDPTHGDYPRIKCDQAIWWYMTDDTVHTYSGSDRLQIGLSCMAYACDCAQDSALQNTIFIDYEVTNLGTQTIFDTWVGNWVDFDLGCATDDYVGSNVEHGVFYGYNGDPDDGSGCAGALGYNTQLPALGAMVFGPNQDFDGVDNPGPNAANGYYVDYATASASDGVTYKGLGHHYGDGIADNERLGLRKFGSYDTGLDPSTPIDFYNLLRGIGSNNLPWLYANTSFDADFIYPGESDPEFWGTQGNTVSPWSEITDVNTPGDRRGIGASGPFTMTPGQVETVTFAYVFAQDYSGSGNETPVDIMLDRAEDISAFIEQNLSCGQTPVGINDVQNNVTLDIYPNPATDLLSIVTDEHIESIAIYSVSGQLIDASQYSYSQKDVDVSELSSGLYLLMVNINNTWTSQRFVKL